MNKPNPYVSTWLDPEGISHTDKKSLALITTSVGKVVGNGCAQTLVRICDIVICNTRYIFGLCPLLRHRVHKPLEFPKWWEHKSVFCYVNEVTLGLHLRMGAGCRENQPWDQRVGIFSPPAHDRHPTWGWKLNQLPLDNNLVNLDYYVMKLHKSAKGWVQRACPLVTTWRCWESSPPGESMEASHSFPIPCTMHSSIWLFLNYILL